MRKLVGLLLLLPLAAGGAELISADLLSDPFFERYQPEVDVSGNVIVGVMTMAAAGALTDDMLGVRLSQMAQATDLCLRATSADGIYTSRNHYRLPADQTGSIHLPYSSSMQEVVAGYGDLDVAIAASVGDCNSSGTDYYVVGSLDAAQSADTVIFLNSFGATDVFVEVDGSDELPEACEPITEGRRTTYDFYCRVVTNAADSVSLNIIRERFGREQPGVRLTLVGLAP
jgi:hypothetical protein